MFVYIWKHNDTPFYVGMTKSIGRTDPLTSSPRGWFCKQYLEKIDVKSVVVEVHRVESLEAAKSMERELILKFGRIQLGTGTLTNLRVGGEGGESMSAENKRKLSERMRVNNPMHDPVTKEKVALRMQEPHVKAKFSGDNNPAKRPEVRAKIKAKWADPVYREAMRLKKLGRPIHTPEEKERRRQKLLAADNPMRNSHIVLNSDPDIKAKRVAALRTPEARAKMSAKLKEVWARKKANM